MIINSISDHEILKSFNNLIPYIPYWFDDEVLFTISNKERFLKVVNGKNAKIKAKDGDIIPPGSCAYECLKAQKPVTVVVPKEVFGLEFKTIGIPVKDDNGEVVGTFVVGRPSWKQDISVMSENVATAIDQISTSINDVLTGAHNISNSNTEIASKVEELNKETKNTDDVLGFVNNIAQQTNLLGLNAQIEAARAGDLGRGFAVVAQEIRKLSDTSKESIKKISNSFNTTKSLVNRINKEVDETNDIFNRQVNAIQEISATIEELSSIAKNLENIASRL